jgi:hypothetical protein
LLGKARQGYDARIDHYGYDGGTTYAKANKVFERELMRRAKSAMGLTGVRGKKENWGDCIAFRPYGSNTSCLSVIAINPLASWSRLMPWPLASGLMAG